MEQESHAAATAAAPSHQDRHLVFDQGSRVTPFQEFAFKTAGNDDGMTRDFLGLRPLSNSEILDIANLQPNYMNPNNTSKSADHTVI